MTLGEFGRKLRKLNRNLHIFAKDTGKPAGINLLFDNEWVSVCSIDKNEIPMQPIRESNGRYIKGGWRRALKALIARRLIDRMDAQRVFKTRLDYPNPTFDYSKDSIMQRLYAIREERIKRSGTIKEGKVGFKKDDILEMASVIRAARR